MAENQVTIENSSPLSWRILTIDISIDTVTNMAADYSEKFPRPRWLDLAIFGSVAAWICRSAWTGDGGEGWFPLVAGGFLILMHWPIRWRAEPPAMGLRRWVVPVGLFVVGNLFSVVFLQMAGWVWAWRAWTLAHVASAALPVGRSWWAFVFVFPWIVVDLPQLGWWFRLSGAATTEVVFGGLGFPVIREGTRLLVNGLPVSVEAACGGMALLQSLMVVGAIVGLWRYPTGRTFFFLLPLLPVLAWLANTGRIIVITAVGLSAGVEFSQGFFHTWGGVLATVGMLIVTVLTLQAVHGLRLIRIHR